MLENSSSIEHIDENPQLFANECGYLTQEDVDEIKQCSYWMEGVLLLVIGVIGVMGNILSIFIFHREKSIKQFSCLLIFLVIADNLFLIFTILDYCLVRVFMWPFSTGSWLWKYIVPKGLYPLNNISLTSSSYLTVMIAFERYRSVCFPSHFRQSNVGISKKRVLGYTAPAIFLSILINLPKFLETEFYMDERIIDERNNTVIELQVKLSDLRNNPTYINYYNFWVRFLGTGVIPMGLLCYFTIRIIQGIRESRKRIRRMRPPRDTQAAAKRQQRFKSELNLGVVLITIALLHVVTNIPRVLLNFIEFLMLDKVVRCNEAMLFPVWFDCLTSGNHLLLVINSSINIFVFLQVSSGFRETFFHELKKLKGSVACFFCLTDDIESGNGSEETLEGEGNIMISPEEGGISNLFNNDAETAF